MVELIVELIVTVHTRVCHQHQLEKVVITVSEVECKNYMLVRHHLYDQKLSGRLKKISYSAKKGKPIGYLVLKMSKIGKISRYPECIAK